MISEKKIAIFVLSMVGVAGCGKVASSTEVHVTLSEYKLALDQASIPAGPVKFVINNMGTLVHEVVLERAGDADKPFEANGKESEVENIGPGTSATLEWTIDQPGQYQLACHIEEPENHYAAGMVKTFMVTP